MATTADETSSAPAVRAPAGRVRQRQPLAARAAADPRFLHVLDTTLDGLRESLTEDMPPGPLRDYWLWGLDADTPFHHHFVQAIGARQLCRLTVTMLDGLVSDLDWPVLTNHITTMNVYQIYEIVSDNLGIGTAAGGQETQREVLHGLSSAMVAALNGAPQSPADLLSPIQPATMRLSGFMHSLNGPAHTRMAAAFTTSGPDRPTTTEIEYGLWPALVANVVSCVDVAESLAGLRIGAELRHGLVNRYTGVSRTLTEHHLPLPELTTVGSHAILVAPTLAFYVGVLGEILHPDPGFGGCVTDGTLPEALHDAALLVRLLNDIGPGLLRGTPEDRWRLVNDLEQAHADEPERYPDLRALLLSDAVPSTVLTRLRKDVEHGEFNVALYALRRIESVPHALAALDDALDYFATIYGLHSARLRNAVTSLGVRLADRRPIELISRFVRFHEELYAHPYTDATGDYAV